jgi:histidyl-tRNA synthetase
MIEEKDLDPAVADCIGEYVKLSGGLDLVTKLTQNQDLMKNKNVKEALDDMKLLLEYMELFNISDKVIVGVSFELVFLVYR